MRLIERPKTCALDDDEREDRMSKQKKIWVKHPPTPAKPAVPPALKATVEQKVHILVEEFLKPTYIQPPPTEQRFNYLINIWTKWYRGYFYFCSTYASPGANALSPSFEAKFARLEYIGNERFNVAYMRHTEQWWEILTNLTIDECITAIRDEPHFHP
jgi:hypothetical protein